MPKKASPNVKTEAPPWSVPVAIDHIPVAGLHRDLEAPAGARAGIAALADVRELAAMSASFDLAHDGAAIHVSGRVRGRVGQTCVVTLEPIETDIDEAVDITFAPPAAEAPVEAKLARTTAQTPADEPPEPLSGSSIDLGAIATEFLILGIDPYPRKAGVEFAPPVVENDDPHPFAALEALKTGPDDKKK